MNIGIEIGFASRGTLCGFFIPGSSPSPGGKLYGFPWDVRLWAAFGLS